MSRTFMPKAHYLQINGDNYRPMYRWYKESLWTLVPGGHSYPNARRAIEAAEFYMEKKMNPAIRSDKAAVAEDALGVDDWYRNRAGQAARDQMEAMGSLIVKGRQIKVETRKARA